MLRFFRNKEVRLGEDQLGYLTSAVNSTIRKLSTLSAFGVSHNKGRDLKEVFGYPSEGERDYSYYWDRYKFQDYASRIIHALPRSCWRDGVLFRPEVESEEELLSEEMKVLKEAGLFQGLERADVLNRIGKFSVLFVGVPDGKDPKEPIDGRGAGGLENVYFAPYSEPAITVVQYDQDAKSRRYGLPLAYTLNPSAGVSSASGTRAVDTRQAITVHWSRVVHLAEGALDNGIFGVPALEPVANRLVDLNKAIGGSAEAYYRNVAHKYTMDVDKEAKMTAADMEALDESAQAWLNEWKTFIGVRGAKIRSHSADTGSPKDTVDVALQAISGATGIPMRILTGEGAGQLAGNEDKASYNQLIADRQEQNCEGWFLQTMRIVAASGLVKLPEKFVLEWPVPEAMDEKAKSEVDLNEARTAEARSRAIATYSSAPGADLVVPPDTFLSEVMGFDADQITVQREGLSALGDG